MRELEEYMEESLKYGYITCDECGNHIEIDCDVCVCGWENPVMLAGLV